MDRLVGYTQAADWIEGRSPIAWPENATLQRKLDLGRSQLRALIRLGQEHGLFEMDDGPGGRRRPIRADGSRVVEAYGFDLTPLAARRAEFERIAAADDERRREGKRLRGRITALSKRVQALADAGAGQGTPGADWPALAAQAHALMMLRGDSEDPCQLAPLVERLMTLRDAAKTALKAGAAGVSEGVSPGETGPSGPADRTPNTTTTELSTANADTAAIPTSEVGPKRPEAHRESSSRNRPSTHGQAGRVGDPETGKPAPRAPTSALRGFVVTTDWLVQTAPAFRGWVGSARPSWEELAEAAIYVRGELEISKQAWGQACVLLGRMEAIATLAVIATRHARGEVRSPEALLRKMVELHGRGELRLDRSLFGLMESPHEGRRRDKKPGAGRGDGP